MKTTMSLLQISFLLFVFSCTNSNNTSTGLLTASSATDKNVEQQFNSIKENTVENTEQKPDSVKERTIENIEFILANSTARNWVNYYKLYDSTFSLHNFIGGREYEMQETEGCICATFDDCFDKRFTNLLIYSPDKKMYVDINSYGMALDENNNAIFDVDQAINIVDVKNKTSTSIGFFGSVGRVENAFWKDNSTIVLLGSINYPKSSPFVTIVDLKNKTEKQYSYKNSLDFNSDYFMQRLRKKGIIGSGKGI